MTIRRYKLAECKRGWYLNPDTEGELVTYEDYEEVLQRAEEAEKRLSLLTAKYLKLKDTYTPLGDRS